MKKKILIVLMLVVLSVVWVAPLALATGDNHDENGGPRKVTICHIPPGNPDNAHEITISWHALVAHKKNHGDTKAPCKDNHDHDDHECPHDADK